VQLAEVGAKVPVEFVPKTTAPVGVVGVELVSVTVAVQLAVELTCIGDVLHETIVVVA